MAQRTRTFYFLTRRGEGHGIGHWKRSCRLAEELRARAGETPAGPVGAEVLLPWEDGDWLERVKTPPGAAVFLCDCRETPESLFTDILNRGAVAAIDEGGACRDRFDLLADTMPALNASTGKPLSSPNFYISQDVSPQDFSPGNSLPVPDAPGRLLVSFGGEDPAGLTEIFLETYRRLPLLSARENQDFLQELTPQLVRGPLFRRFPEPASDFSVLDSPHSLAEPIREARLVVTSWGLTLWEAALRNKPAVILNPTSYHDALCRHLRLPHHPSGRKLTPRRLRALLGLSREVPRIIRRWQDSHPARELVPALLAMDPGEIRRLRTSPAASPAASPADSPAAETPVVLRYPRRSYRLDRQLGSRGLTYQQPLEPPPGEYGTDYFGREYQEQYGRTYLEDFNHIKALGHRRMEIIRHLLPDGTSLLDVGCAYGPFLQAAAEGRMKPFGLDISPEAVAYVREALGFPAAVSSLLDWEPDDAAGPWDAVTLWFVLEHLPRLDRAGSLLRKLVKPGGILALSLPNRYGLTGRFRPRSFLRDNPRDHYLLFDPSSLSAFLNRWGFDTEEVRMTGIHPERFTGKLRLIPAPLRQTAARWMGWGDTFEIYARRRKWL